MPDILDIGCRDRKHLLEKRKDEYRLQKEIKKCLECTKEECVNCIEFKKKRIGKQYPFEGEMLTVSEIASILGMTRQALYNRIKVGGYEYAISECRTLKQWKQSKNK